MSDPVIWDCLHRIKVLKEFNAEIKAYLSSVRNITEHPENPVLIEDADVLVKSRESINLMIPEVSRYLRHSGHYPTMVHYKPLNAGGDHWMDLDMLDNFFRLERFNIDSYLVIDYIHRSVGYYENDKSKSLVRTINPFWWFERLMSVIIRTPFRIIKWAGFDAAKAESSPGGKFYKVIFGFAAFVSSLVIFIAAVVQILDSFNLIESLTRFIQSFAIM